MIGSLHGYAYLEVSRAIKALKEANERKDAITLKLLQNNVEKEIT
jgi:hypothetical protein